MKPTGVLFSAICCMFLFGLKSQGQLSFFQPSAYFGSGQLFGADFNQDGKTDLLTSDGTMNLGRGDGTFTTGTKVTIPAGFSLWAVADFNGDGKPDALEQGAGTLRVLLGNGDGTFQSTAISTNGVATLALIVAVDLNNDGRADVVGVSNSQLVVYLSRGNGSFASAVSYNLGSTSASELSLGDFNGDRNMDVVVSTRSSIVPGQVFVFLGQGDGTLGAAKMSVGVSNPAYSAVADFNGDGNLDLALNGKSQVDNPSVHLFDELCPASSSLDCNVYILLGNGDGTFRAPMAVFRSSSGPLATSDFNSDGNADLMLAGDAYMSVGQIYLGRGDGTFADTANYILQFSSRFSPLPVPVSASIALADFNGDGHQDVAVSNAAMLGNGDGTFQGVHLVLLDLSLEGGTSFFGTAGQVTGDFDGDGTRDVAVVCGVWCLDKHVYILKNDGTGSLSLTHTYSLQHEGRCVVSADFNEDGNLDLVVLGESAYSVLLGNGDGSFQAPLFSSQSGMYQGKVVLADFNNDQKLDIATSRGTIPPELLLGIGDGSFAAPLSLEVPSDLGVVNLSSGDFNSDGKLDIAIGGNVMDLSGEYLIPKTAILYGNGDGTFQTPLFPSSLDNFEARYAANINNDAAPDLVSGSGSQFALGKGDGSFTVLPISKPGGESTANVGAISDFNRDGIPDALILTYLKQIEPSNNRWQSAVLLGNGDGTFSSSVDVPTIGQLPPLVEVADMNGDGYPDIIFPWSAEVNGVGVLINSSPKSAPSDFLMNSSSTYETVSAGRTATFDLLVVPYGSFSGTINLSCSVTPVESQAPTCSLSSSSMQISPGGAAQNLGVIVATTGPVSTGAVSHVSLPRGAMPPIWMITVLSLALYLLRSRKRLAPLAAPIAMLLVVSWSGCGGNGSSSSSSHSMSGTPAGTYTVAVTASSGSVNHRIALTVVVQ